MVRPPWLSNLDLWLFTACANPQGQLTLQVPTFLPEERPEERTVEGERGADISVWLRSSIIQLIHEEHVDSTCITNRRIKYEPVSFKLVWLIS